VIGVIGDRSSSSAHDPRPQESTFAGEPTFSFPPHYFTDHDKKTNPTRTAPWTRYQFSMQTNPPRMADEGGNERGRCNHQGRRLEGNVVPIIPGDSNTYTLQCVSSACM
jgi:hypothetical protein